MTQADLIPLVEKLKHARVLCVGDLMLDHYIYGRVERISPEAPIPVLHSSARSAPWAVPGTFCAISTRSASRPASSRSPAPILLDAMLARMVASLGGVEAHVLSERDRTTTLKTRYIAGTQQLLRADREQVAPLPPELRADLVKLATEALRHHKVAILSDYAKGVLGDGIAAEIIAAVKRQAAWSSSIPRAMITAPIAAPIC